MGSTGDVVLLMVSVITEKLDSLGALNRLIRTNKKLNVEANRICTISKVVSNMQGMNRRALFRLFVLPSRKVFADYVVDNELYPPGLFSCKHSFTPSDAFKCSLLMNDSIRNINRLSGIRKNQSNTMRLVWASKKKMAQNKCEAREAREYEIKIIHESLHMKHNEFHTSYVTDAETKYLNDSWIGHLNFTYRDHKFIAHHLAGILHHPDNTFQMVALKDMQDWSSLSQDERLYILGKNIAYEHFLFNYTNYLDILHDNDIDVSQYENDVQYLFKPPSVWPWVDASPSFHVVYDNDTNEEEYDKFREYSDTLY